MRYTKQRKFRVSLLKRTMKTIMKTQTKSLWSTTNFQEKYKIFSI